MTADGARPGRRRIPRRRAGQQIVEAVVEAAEQLVAEAGIEHLTTARLAERSGTSVGSIYQYFESKEAVLFEVGRRLERRALGLAVARLAALPEASLADARDIFIDVLLGPELGHLRVRQAVLRFVPREGMERESRSVDEDAAEVVAEILARHRDALRPGPVNIMGFVVQHALESVVESAVLQAPELLEDPAFREELRRLASAYLGLSPPEPASPPSTGSETR
ncbi:MAG: TetR/AcrR family transcriptional regulator [Myxococcota bacterium]